MKKLKNWNGFKRNEIVIYAIALMLVTAGYFNYTTNIAEPSIKTSTDQSVNTTLEEANIGDARLVSNNEITAIEDSNKNEEVTEGKKEDIDIAISTEEANDKGEINVEEKKEESAETSSKPEENKSDYFVETKLERDKGYASQISTYTKILEDNTVSETQKSIAMKEITKINSNKNAISVCENLLSTKGFTNSVVLVNNESVNVVIQKKEKLATAEVAQIQNIISREFSVKIENIHISEKD